MAYPNLHMETSVVEALKRTAKYGVVVNGKNQIIGSAQKIGQENLKTTLPNGETREHIMGEISGEDIAIFGSELDIAMKLLNPFVQSLFAKNAENLVHLMRGVQYQTRSGFKGTTGSGNALDAILLRAEQTQDPDSAVVLARTSWQRTIAAASTLQMVCAADALGANAHAALTMALTEGFALLGWVNPAAIPCTSAFAVQYLGVNYNVQNLAFENADIDYGYPLIELKQPLFIWPGETGLVTVRYFQAGIDNLTPVGLWIKTANNLRALATS